LTSKWNLIMETHELIVTCDVQSTELALQELQEIEPGNQHVDGLGPGVIRTVHGQTFTALAETMTEHPPTFIRHMCPVHVTAELSGRAEDVETIRQYVALELVELIEPTQPFSVQTRLLGDAEYRPFAVNDALANLIADMTGAPLDVRNPVQVLSVVICVQDSGVGGGSPGKPALQGHGLVGYMGVSTVRQNLSDWAGGVRRFAREEGQISRSEFKLLEALDVFGIELVPRSTALDLGASPGGWTRVLRNRDIYVTAVDPGDLDSRLAGDRGIRYTRMTAEAYLRDEPDPFDMIVNDMRMDARDSARLMVDFAPYLYPQGMAIMTLKLPLQNTRRVLEHALSILGESYTVAAMRQLFHNRSEVTLVLHKLAK
jgi:23S rRNA (cytidine2498-2'-O)-methyltransferase